MLLLCYSRPVFASTPMAHGEHGSLPDSGLKCLVLLPPETIDSPSARSLWHTGLPSVPLNEGDQNFLTAAQILFQTIMPKNKETLIRGFRVLVDDNFHFMDEDERTHLGDFSTYDEAVAVAQRVVESFFEGKGGKSARELYDDYTSFGDDPFIIP